jgi:hypothetical protein
VSTTHLHLLLGLAHRLQVPSHRCRVDKIVRQQLEPATTTHHGFGHWRQADWLRAWISGERMTSSRAGSGSKSSPFPPVLAVDSSMVTSISSGDFSGSLLSLRCHILNGNRQRDIASLSLSTCR